LPSKITSRRRYITRGWNALFDCFDCQHHVFSLNSSSAEDNKPLHGDLKYAVKVNLSCTAPDCSYIPREVFQSFSQLPNETYHLQNHNNTLAEMHYADDWCARWWKGGGRAYV
jgi:hypothetical protein